MSKSYGNTIPLFAPREGAAKLINRDRDRLDAARGAQGAGGRRRSTRSTRCRDADETLRARRALPRGGIGWGDAKKAAVRAPRAQLAAARERYDDADGRPGADRRLLAAGAARARAPRGERRSRAPGDRHRALRLTAATGGVISGVARVPERLVLAVLERAPAAPDKERVGEPVQVLDGQLARRRAARAPTTIRSPRRVTVRPRWKYDDGQPPPGSTNDLARAGRR